MGLWISAKVIPDYIHFLLSGIPDFYGSFTLRETYSGTDSDSNPIPVVSSSDWNLNLTLYRVKTSP